MKINEVAYKIGQLSLRSRLTHYKLSFVENRKKKNKNKNKKRNENPLVFPNSQLEALQFVLGL